MFCWKYWTESDEIKYGDNYHYGFTYRILSFHEMTRFLRSFHHPYIRSFVIKNTFLIYMHKT